MTRRSINAPKVVSRAEGPLNHIESKKWDRISRIDELVRTTIKNELRRTEAEAIAKQVQIHWTSVYRYRRRLLDQEIATAVAGRIRGFPKGSSRLTTIQKSITDQVIARLARKSKKLRVVDVCEEVMRRCRTDGIQMPSRSSIDRCLRRMIPTLILLHERD